MASGIDRTLATGRCTGSAADPPGGFPGSIERALRRREFAGEDSESGKDDERSRAGER
jgi:hypothetical protein